MAGGYTARFRKSLVRDCFVVLLCATFYLLSRLHCSQIHLYCMLLGYLRSYHHLYHSVQNLCQPIPMFQKCSAITPAIRQVVYISKPKSDDEAEDRQRGEKVKANFNIRSGSSGCLPCSATIAECKWCDCCASRSYSGNRGRREP